MAGWNGWAWLGGPIIGGRPVAGRNVDGRLEVFGHASGGTGLEIVHAWQNAPGADWSAWDTLGTPSLDALGDVVLGENGDGRLELFARVGLMSSGTSWHIWQNFPPTTGWSAWDTLGAPPGGLANVVAEVGRNADGRLEVFAFGADGAVWHIWQQTAGGWSGWHSLDMPPGATPFALAVGGTTDSRLAVCVAVLGGGLWRRQQTAPGAGWDVWEDLGMPGGVALTNVTVSLNADGRQAVFAVGSDGNLWQRAESTAGGSWASWDNLATPAPSTTLDRPSVAANLDGRLEVFTISRAAAGSELWHTWQTAPGGGWSAWESLGGNPGGIAVAQNDDGRLELFATLGDGTPGGQTGLLHRWQTIPNGPAGWSADQAWIPTLSGAISRLAQTTQGTTFAWGTSGLFMSQDAGITWTTLTTPSPITTPGMIGIDPTEAQTIFAAGGSQINKTTDGGATWTPVLATSGFQVLAIAVSPADHNVVFVALAQFSAGFQVYRTQDGGTTWTRIEGPINGAICMFNVLILVPHPTDASRVLRTSGCYAGRDVPSGDSLDQSTDQGVTWNPLFHPRPLFPSQLVGGTGSQPARWYLSGYFGASPGGTKLFRSDDDGVTWSDVLDYATGPAIVGVAYDPGAPDRVFVALTGDLVRQSSDGGASWTDLSSGPTSLSNLLLTPDGHALLAATQQGIWRIEV
jgi:hypothetical protein